MKINHAADVTKLQVAKWPAGKYCIFANGPCPAGFQASSGSMTHTGSYMCSDIKGFKFGTSSLTTKHTCRYGAPMAALYLSTCCK